MGCSKHLNLYSCWLTNHWLSHESIEFVRAICEDDLVALYTQQVWPGNDQYVTMTFFMLNKNVEIVKHWDAIQEIPKISQNKNTKY